MTLQELGSLGEFAAAIGLIFSLIFVAVEIRQSRKLARVSGVEDRMTAWIEWSRLLLENPDLRTVYRKGGNDFGALSEDEKFVFGQLMATLNNILLKQFHRATQLNDTETLKSTRNIVGGLYSSNENMKVWWQNNGSSWRQDFREFVNEAVLDSGASTGSD